MAALALSLARTTVEIWGHETFRPIQNHFLQLATKGYVSGQDPNWVLRIAADREIDPNLPVTPLIATPGETLRHAFLYLDPKQARELADDFLHGGQSRAAKALYEWSLGDDTSSEDQEPGDATLGRDWALADSLEAPVFIDLATGFDQLIGELENDPIGATDFDHLIRKLQQTLGLTVYMVTHDLDTIFTVADRVAVLADKKIVRTGSPSELQHHPNHPWIKEYFCGERARAASPTEERRLIANDA